MSDNRRSRMITEGFQRTPNRAMLRAVGFTDEDFSKPIVGIANGYSNLTPCNIKLDDLSKAAFEAIKVAGGMPMLKGTPTLKYIAPSRSMTRYFQPCGREGGRSS